MNTTQLPPYFWDNVNKQPNGCWIWTGSRDAKGYGKYIYKNVHYRVHRVMQEMYNGPIPEGQVVMHACDNPSCCNPAHLSVGTNADNCRDRTSKGRQAVGSRHGRSKLSESLVKKIRQEIKRLPNGRVVRGEYRRLMEKYGVTHPTLHRAVVGETWNHIKDGP